MRFDSVEVEETRVPTARKPGSWKSPPKCATRSPVKPSIRTTHGCVYTVQVSRIVQEGGVNDKQPTPGTQGWFFYKWANGVRSDYRLFAIRPHMARPPPSKNPPDSFEDGRRDEVTKR